MPTRRCAGPARCPSHYWASRGPARRVGRGQTSLHGSGWASACPLFYVSRSQPLPAAPATGSGMACTTSTTSGCGPCSHGNWGTSFRTGQAVTGRDCGQALVIHAAAHGHGGCAGGAAALGLAQRLATGPWWQRPLRAVLVAAARAAAFVVALVLLLVFANPEVLAWFPAYGLEPQRAGSGPGTGLAAGQITCCTWYCR